MQHQAGDTPQPVRGGQYAPADGHRARVPRNCCSA